MATGSIHGLLVIDKPRGMTSRDAVDRGLGWFPRGTRLGHAGTLDPLATGVLMLCAGTATRLIEYVQAMDKVYHTGALLGVRSTTDDADGLVTRVADAQAPTAAAVAECLAGFVGEIVQVPPAYSAAKVTGRRAYDLARRGERVSLAPRRVRVYGVEVQDYQYPRLVFDVRCGKGTYVRSLVRDLGERLGCGALVESLRRTRTGPFRIEEAIPLDASVATARAQLRPLAAAVSALPQWPVSAEGAAQLRHGQLVPLGDDPDRMLGEGGEVAAIDPAGVLVGVAVVDPDGRTLRPAKILAPGDSDKRSGGNKSLDSGSF